MKSHTSEECAYLSTSAETHSPLYNVRTGPISREAAPLNHTETGAFVDHENHVDVMLLQHLGFVGQQKQLLYLRCFFFLLLLRPRVGPLTPNCSRDRLILLPQKYISDIGWKSPLNQWFSAFFYPRTPNVPENVFCSPPTVMMSFHLYVFCSVNKNCEYVLI